MSEKAAVLTEQEKALRDRLSPEDWMIVKAGFRRSYVMALDEAETRIEARFADWIALGGSNSEPPALHSPAWLVERGVDAALAVVRELRDALTEAAAS